MSGLLEGKKGLILGVANHRSLAWAIAGRTAEHGARLGITYQGERFRRRIEKMVTDRADMKDALLWPCDATSAEDLDRLFAAVRTEMGQLDFLVHCWAYAPAEDLSRDYVDTRWEGHRVAQQVSVHSLTEAVRRCRPLMEEGGSVITLTYYGAEKVVPGYNVMGVAKASLEAVVRYLASDVGRVGIRVNAISAGPVNTLSARGVPGFLDMLSHHRERAPLRRNVEAEEIAGAALFLASSLSSGITGEVLHVDAGYNIMGMG
ncbi:MAG: enoyl-ACP reductase [Bacillota bacterium]